MKSFLVGLLMTLSLAGYVIAHDTKWELQCTETICCSVNQENGQIGDCRVKP